MTLTQVYDGDKLVGLADATQTPSDPPLTKLEKETLRLWREHQQQAEQIRQLEDMLMFRIEDISRLESELLNRPPLPLEGEARSRILQEMGATGIDDAIRKHKQQAEQIAQLKEKLAKEIESHATTLGLRKD